MSEFNIEDVDEVIRTAESALVQMLALQLQKALRQQGTYQSRINSLEALTAHSGWVLWRGDAQPVESDLWVETFWDCGSTVLHKAWLPRWGDKALLAYRIVK